MKPASTHSAPVVLKHLRLKESFDFGAKNLNSIHSEAMVMEILASSNRTTDFYGFCATSIWVQAAKDVTRDIVPELESQPERGRILQEDLDRLSQDRPYSFNNFTTVEKLIAAISMAEALAEMHGYKGGVIVHDDVHPDQWLVTYDGRIILNDINNAEPLHWSYETKEFCPYYTSYGGTFRAPEEFTGEDSVDDKVDIWPMGNMIFDLLTGLWPYYGTLKHKKVRQLALDGQRPFLDPRFANSSFIEGRLVEIMNLCHVRNPKDRADIFQVVAHLRETWRMYLEQDNDAPLAIEKSRFRL